MLRTYTSSIHRRMLRSREAATVEVGSLQSPRCTGRGGWSFALLAAVWKTFSIPKHCMRRASLVLQTVIGDHADATAAFTEGLDRQ